MSVNIVTGSDNKLTKVAGLGAFLGEVSDEYVTVDQLNSTTSEINNSINVLRQLINNLQLGENVVSGYYNPTSDTFYTTAAAAEQQDSTYAITPEVGKIYIDLNDDNYSTYRWNGTTYLTDGYYPLTGGTIQGWCEVEPNSCLYVPNKIYLTEEGTTTINPPEIYYNTDQADTTLNGLTIANNGNAVRVTTNYTRFSRSIWLKTRGEDPNDERQYGPHIILDRRAGIYSYDKIGQQFPMIYQNISNLWIGAAEDQNYHHCGKTYISTGYDQDSLSSNPTAWEANDTIYIAVPYYNPEAPAPILEGHPNDSYLYSVLHTGNLIQTLQDNPTLLSRLKTTLGI